MIADLVILGIMALAAVRGYRRGVALTVLGIAGVGGGYLGALLLARPLGGALAGSAGPPLVVALPLAGMLILGSAGLITRVLSGRLETARRQDRERGVPARWADSAGGAALAAGATGAIAVVVVSLVAGALALAGGAPSPLAGSFAARLGAPLTRSLVYLGARGAIRDPLGSAVLAAIAADPRRGVQALETVTRDQRIQALWSDPALRQALARQDRVAIADHPMVRALASDSAFRNAAERIGLARSGVGAAGLSEALATRVGPLVRSVESLRSDPELRQMLEDPELRARLDAGEVGSILTDQRFNGITRRLFGGAGR